ncbi:sec-independent protein translocase protein TatA [Stackebrandtia endophytica]|uniref:Sec-independent protein translocase protein TatA n=1 Tax=Stackebrandtia endophytica TaxID=1496996 RepID=A0A543AQZ9_9ACTN|nr:Sec-independent protein translocase subunit TatA [Stackebrandtia endophytica]TQL75011.1 sec-independent protein translocase protein TatA [Stackebrandtia endophytica]
MGALKPWHILVLVVVLVLLFGAKKLPGAARGLGQSLRILKSETKTLRDEDVESESKADAKHSREPLERTVIEGETTSVKTEKPREQA